MTEIFHNLSEKTADIYMTVLAAAGIVCRTGKSESGWHIYVRTMDVEKALKSIALYHAENRDVETEQHNVPKNLSHTTNLAGFYAAFVLAAVHVFVNTVADKRTVVENYGSSASGIIRGEQYRTITALLLHGDFLHLMGNMLGITLFGTAVCSITGWGVGLLIIVFTGSIGNLINAYFYQTAHLSIGASTSVFGCIGFLSAYQFMDKIRLPGQKLKAWMTIGAGFALLAILGSSEYTDIMAHFFGFAAGIILGLLYRSIIPSIIPSIYQYVCLIILLGLLCVPWIAGPPIR